MIYLSVIIPTHNRPAKLLGTIACLQQQTLAHELYEIIVVDDGSFPPVALPANTTCKLIRTEGIERSAARNLGAAQAQGELLIFIDDDIEVAPEFLAAHWQAYQEWPHALLIGKISLSPHTLQSPFGRFRQQLEQHIVPRQRGLTEQKNLCAAANMAIARTQFQALHGFDETMTSSEDQDFALRFTNAGGQICYVPEAASLHFDNALDIKSYCRRTEWGSENMIPFVHRYVNWPDNVERERVNGLVKWGQEPFLNSFRKLVKNLLSLQIILNSLFLLAALLERIAPAGKTLDRVYRLLLGVHIFRGYRKGLSRFRQDKKSDSQINSSLASTSH